MWIVRIYKDGCLGNYVLPVRVLIAYAKLRSSASDTCSQSALRGCVRTNIDNYDGAG